MKKQIFSLLGLLLLAESASAQQNFTNTNPAGILSGQANQQFWSRAGNNATIGTNNIFGTLFNSPIYTITNNVVRTRLAGTLVTNINGVNQNVTGYFGIGVNGYFQNNSPWTMLHLEGPNATAFGGGGWRSWMQTGLLTKENSDNMYIGMKSEVSVLTGTNYSDAVINWGDDGFGPGGPDDLRFLFTAAAPGNGTCTNCPTTATGLNGREVMRLNPNGNVGIGPVFSKIPVGGANQPQSMLHLNSESNLNAWLQISNQNGTGQTANDGTRLGILDNGTSLLYNQENRQLLFSTSHTTPSNAAAGTNERMRIMALNTPTVLPGGGTGVYNPGANPFGDATRVSISYDPGNPITRPMSLLHLGYNTGSIGNPASTDGWRPWMDVGMFVAQGTDNVYIGMKPEASNIPLQPDRYDAVISWGDNQVPIGPLSTGPDNLRFIFTSTTGNGAGAPPSTSTNGLEVARFTPTGQMGIGNYAPSGPQGPGSPGYINATLDIDGDERIRTVIQDNTLTEVLVIDPTDRNRVHWRDAATLGGGGGVTADNGATINPAGNVQWGQVLATAGGQLLHHTEVPLNNFNVQFTDGGAQVQGVNRFQIGQTVPVGQSEKFYVYNTIEENGSMVETNAASIPQPISLEEAAASSRIYNLNNPSVVAIGDRGVADNTNCKANYGVYGIGSNAITANYGVVGLANTTVSGQNHGGAFVGANSSAANYGVQGTAFGTATSFGGQFHGQNTAANDAYGVYATGAGGTNTYGIYAQAFSGTNNYAGWFEGDVVINNSVNCGSGYALTSDQNLKTQIDTITDALSLIVQLQPKTFFFDSTVHPQMKLSDRRQYGLVAQQVETVMPELVFDKTFPAKYDSAGNQLSTAFNYKSLNYNAFIAILMKGMQEQERLISDQQAQLTALQAQVNGCCSSARAGNPNENQIDVELRNDQSIVLDQNVPNPFAEQTTISFFLPDNVQKAQLLFYNMEGKLIHALDLQERGKRQINVFANDLSNGVYTYTLVADGQIIASKRMVKNK